MSSSLRTSVSRAPSVRALQPRHAHAGSSFLRHARWRELALRGIKQHRRTASRGQRDSMRRPRGTCCALTRCISGIPVRTYTHEVVTLWYRAPEILLGALDCAAASLRSIALTRPFRACEGAKHYSTPVDLWCVPHVQPVGGAHKC